MGKTSHMRIHVPDGGVGDKEDGVETAYTVTIPCDGGPQRLCDVHLTALLHSCDIPHANLMPLPPPHPPCQTACVRST